MARDGAMDLEAPRLRLLRRARVGRDVLEAVEERLPGGLDAGRAELRLAQQPPKLIHARGHGKGRIEQRGLHAPAHFGKVFGCDG